MTPRPESVPADNPCDLPDGVFEPAVAIARRPSNVGQLLEWAKAEPALFAAPGVLGDVVYQDEFTHDLVVPMTTGLVVVYSSTCLGEFKALTIWNRQPTAAEILQRRLATGWTPTPSGTSDGPRVLGYAACAVAEAPVGVERPIGTTHPTVIQTWRRYCDAAGLSPASPLPPVWHFCDNETDADALLALVLSGRKRATTPSLWHFEAAGMRLPAVGDVEIVTSWAGVAGCVIRTTHLDVRTFSEIDAAYAALEGEGDGSIEHWRATHWAYYERELASTGRQPTLDMPLLCQHFDVVWRADDGG